MTVVLGASERRSLKSTTTFLESNCALISVSCQGKRSFVVVSSALVFSQGDLTRERVLFLFQSLVGASNLLYEHCIRQQDYVFVATEPPKLQLSLTHPLTHPLTRVRYPMTCHIRNNVEGKFGCSCCSKRGACQS